ncbi:hypothetical protein B0J17DRAFT_381211 [Rhizoctonia solani]|nr:hypothetical protein B0J17DRAFT_381211 [Rhizoctonia solani]
MPPSQTRSRSGCLTCKARRKKCDETKPFCQRCEHTGVQCSGYSFLGATNDGKIVKLWTQPAYSMPPELRPVLTKLSRTVRHGETTLHSSNSSPPEQAAAQDTPGAGPSRRTVSCGDSSQSDTSPDLFNSPFDLDPNHSLSIMTSEALENWWNLEPTLLLPLHQVEDPRPTFQQHPLQPSDVSTATSLTESPDFQHDRASRPLTAGQASLFQALLSLSDPTHDSDPAWPISTATIGYPPTSLPAWSSPVICSDMGRGEQDEDGDEDEGVRQIIYGTMRLDMSAEGNALPYVLESYAAWITRTAFEPKKAAPGARDLILKQFSDSEDSRWTVTTLAKVVRTLAGSSTWGDGLDSLRNMSYQPAVRALRGRVHQKVNEILSHSGPVGEQELSDALQTMGNVMEVSQSCVPS